MLESNRAKLICDDFIIMVTMNNNINSNNGTALSRKVQEYMTTYGLTRDKALEAAIMHLQLEASNVPISNASSFVETHPVEITPDIEQDIEDAVKELCNSFSKGLIPDSFDNDMAQLAEITKNNDLFLDTRQAEKGEIIGGLLTELPGTSRDAEDYNEALKQFRTYYRALHLNMDLSQAPQEAFISGVLDDYSKQVYGGTAGFEGKGEITEDEMVDAFVTSLERDGFKVPDRGEGKSWWNMNRRGKGLTLRNISEGAGGVITDLSPLLIELAAFNISGATKAVHTAVGKVANSLTKKTKSKFWKGLARNVVAPGVATTIEWAAAETLGQALMGGKHSDMWKAQTIDYRTGETRLMFPFAMGASGGMLKMFTDFVKKKI